MQLKGMETPSMLGNHPVIPPRPSELNQENSGLAATVRHVESDIRPFKSQLFKTYWIQTSAGGPE